MVNMMMAFGVDGALDALSWIIASGDDDLRANGFS